MRRKGRKRKSIIFIFLVAIICGGVAFAWYEISNSVETTGLNLNSPTTEGITVYMKIESYDDGSGAGPVTKMLMSEINDNDSAVIDIGLEQLTNIKAGMIAPGSYGEIHFYITTPTIETNGYEINIIPKFSVHEEYVDDNSKLLEILQKHILFYTVKDGNGYSGKFDIEDIANVEEGGYLNGDKQTIRGDLEQINVEKEVIVYWYWPYEYADVPGVYPAEVTDENIRNYDLEDTLMGNYLNSFALHFEVKGIKHD